MRPEAPGHRRPRRETPGGGQSPPGFSRRRAEGRARGPQPRRARARPRPRARRASAARRARRRCGPANSAGPRRAGSKAARFRSRPSRSRASGRPPPPPRRTPARRREYALAGMKSPLLPTREPRGLALIPPSRLPCKGRWPSGARSEGLLRAWPDAEGFRGGFAPASTPQSRPFGPRQLPFQGSQGAWRLSPHSSSFSTDRNASVGIETVPSWRIFFLPSFCFSRSFFFLVMSPP